MRARWLVLELQRLLYICRARRMREERLVNRVGFAEDVVVALGIQWT